MKKKLSILLFALMAGFLFSACSKDEAPAPKQESAPTTPAPVAEAPAAPAPTPTPQESSGRRKPPSSHASYYATFLFAEPRPAARSPASAARRG